MRVRLRTRHLIKVIAPKVRRGARRVQDHLDPSQSLAQLNVKLRGPVAHRNRRTGTFLEFPERVKSRSGERQPKKGVRGDATHTLSLSHLLRAAIHRYFKTQTPPPRHDAHLPRMNETIPSPPPLPPLFPQLNNPRGGDDAEKRERTTNKATGSGQKNTNSREPVLPPERSPSPSVSGGYSARSRRLLSFLPFLPTQ